MRLRRLLLISTVTIVMLASLKLISDPAFVRRWRQHSEIYGPLASELRFISRKDVAVQLLEGLPHPKTERKAFAKEMESAKVIDRTGHKFYDNIISVDEADADTLFELLTKAGGYRQTTGVKFCGGFHPDWLISLKRERTIIDVYCCFGCSEVEFRRGDESVHLDMTSATAEQLRDVLDKYPSNRPAFSEF